MTITAMHNADIIEETKWNTHIFFDIPFEGGTAALDYHGENDEGYGFLYYLEEEHPTIAIGSIPAHKDWDGTNGAQLMGDMWSWYDEDDRVWFHGVYTHSVTIGWPAVWLIRQGGIDRVVTQLDTWWAEHEEEIPMNGCRTTLLGWGRHHGNVGSHEMTSPLRKAFLGALANTEAELAVYWTD